MKWQNLTNKIRGSILAALLLTDIVPIKAVAAQETVDTPVVLRSCWGIRSDDPAKSIYASDNDLRLFISKTGSKVESIDLITGKKNWQTELGGDIVSNLSADKESIYIGNNRSSEITFKPLFTTLRSISIDTGIANWNRSLSYSEKIFLGENANSVIAIGSDGSISALKKSDGNLIWQNSPGKWLSGAPYFLAGEVVIPSESREINIVSTINGSTSFRIKTETVPVSVYLIDDNILIWGDAKGNLTAVDVHSKTVDWKFRSGGLISGIIGVNNDILISSYDNFVYLLSSGGKVIWKRRLPGRVVDKPLVTQNFVVVSIVGESGISLISLNSGKLLNKLTTENESYATAAPAAASGYIIFSDGDGIYSYNTGNCTPSK